MNSNAVFIAVWIWLMAAVSQVVLALVDFDPQLRLYFSNAVMLLSSGGSAAVCLGTAMVFPRGSPFRNAWLFIGAGVGAWALGQAVFSLYPLLNAGEDTPYPYYSDAAFLLTAPLISLGLIVLHRVAGLTAPAWGKGLAMILLFPVGYWCYVANADGFFSEGVALSITSFGYAVGDPVLLSITVYVASSFKSGSIMSISWWLVASGIMMYLVGNQLYSYMVFGDIYSTGSVIDTCWTIGFGLIALAAYYTRVALK